MTLDSLISSSDFLYRHSPAGFITAGKNTILVCGKNGDDLANAFFELIFCTAYTRDIDIRLIRLCPGEAAQAEIDFVSRNEAGISAFARHDFGPEAEHRPLTVHFYDYGDPEWLAFRDQFAYAVNTDSGSVTVPCAPCYEGRDIPVLSPGNGSWSDADEKDCEVLRIARRVHTAYTAGWNSRYTEQEITHDLYDRTPDDGNASYCLRSSLRAAVSIPWKLSSAGIVAGPDAARELYGRLSDPDGRIRYRLAWQEHRSWLAFMILEGWNMPTADQMKEYVFRDHNDHRNVKQRFHPCLCDVTGDDWYAPYPKTVKKLSDREWSRAYEHMDDFCKLDRISLTIHHFCKEIVESPAYRDRMRRLFDRLEVALLRSGAARTEKLLSQAKLMENMFDRLKNNETNSFHPWQRASGAFRKALNRSEESCLGPAKEICGTLIREARVCVERNLYRDYKETSANIIRWLPWIIGDIGVNTIWKLYSKTSLLDNVLSSVILRPRALCLVGDSAALSAAPVGAFRELLQRHGIGDTEVRTVPVSALDAMTVPCQPGSVIDVTGCGDLQNRLHFPEKARVVYYGNNDLQDSAGSDFFAPFFHPYDFFMTVNEMIRLRGREILSSRESNEMLGMERHYLDLWNVSRVIKNYPAKGKAWKYTIQSLQKAERAVTQYAYRGRRAKVICFSHPVPPERLEILANNGVLGVLNALQSRGCIADLLVDTENCLLSCAVSDGDGMDPPSGMESLLKALLDDSSADGDYRLISEFTKHGAPFRIVNLKQPIHIDPAAFACEFASEIQSKKDAETAESIERQIRVGIGNLKGKGLLIPAEKPGDYLYSSPAVRHELEEEGFALEAFVYYSLFLSGQFDDVRSNVRIKTGIGASGNPIEKELDILVTRRGKMGVISCKDTSRFSLLHIGELQMQANLYGINACPMLVCTESLPEDTVRMCQYLNVGLITFAKSDLPERVVRVLNDAR